MGCLTRAEHASSCQGEGGWPGLPCAEQAGSAKRDGCEPTPACTWEQLTQVHRGKGTLAEAFNKFQAGRIQLVDLRLARCSRPRAEFDELWRFLMGWSLVLWSRRSASLPGWTSRRPTSCWSLSVLKLSMTLLAPMMRSLCAGGWTAEPHRTCSLVRIGKYVCNRTQGQLDHLEMNQLNPCPHKQELARRDV